MSLAYPQPKASEIESSVEDEEKFIPLPVDRIEAADVKNLKQGR